MEFKGTRIKPTDDFEILEVLNQYQLRVNSQEIGCLNNEEDANISYDAILINQQINCSLTELLEQRNEALDILRVLNRDIDHYHRFVHGTEFERYEQLLTKIQNT